jgi:sulfur transporter
MMTSFLLLGARIALAGACPGTVLAQAGAGYRDAMFTLASGLCGAFAYSYAEPSLKGPLLSDGGGKITFADVAGLPYWVLALPWLSRSPARAMPWSDGGRGATAGSRFGRRSLGHRVDRQHPRGRVAPAQ